MQLNNIPTEGTNALLIMNHNVSEQKQTFNKDNLQTCLNGRKASDSTADQELTNFQIQAFLKFMQEPGRKSLNRYNDPKLLQKTLAGVPIIEQDKFCHLNGVRFIKGLAEGRKCQGDHQRVIEKFECLFSYMGYLQQFPVIFDRNFCIIDGYQRYLAAIKYKTMWIPYIRYDIDLMSECTKEELRDDFEDLDW